MRAMRSLQNIVRASTFAIGFLRIAPAVLAPSVMSSNNPMCDLYLCGVLEKVRGANPEKEAVAKSSDSFSTHFKLHKQRLGNRSGKKNPLLKWRHPEETQYRIHDAVGTMQRSWPC
jgi:hypothetical protein